ncbi:(R)-mandelonitrile lyase-like [Magnolia sinica]|uniref:(R)-mandelonitrile lyase-like n=1 Tax=Magnolia sinica TaxID=86752 RepID=UPI00265ABABF|nr:(R)-mandelonitrile lyase-like [Magnolia sinica]
MTITTVQSLLLLTLLFLPISSQSPHLESTNYIFNATEFPPEEEYDYIVVGGGTAGCPLAATLSEDHRVLLLERGGSSTSFPTVLTREGFLPTLLQTDLYSSPAQSFISEDGVPNARGRILGGSSSINAGFYSRADSTFFLAGSGPIIWDMSLVNASYEWVERAVAFQPNVGIWQSAVRDGLLEANFTPYNGFTVEHVVGTKIGATTFDPSGRRHSAADLLGYATMSNIRVALHASVERVLFDHSPSVSYERPLASGVVYRDHNGRYHNAMLRDKGEVILSAGALGSPQLLLLSGIGPRTYLATWGIPVNQHLPAVGQYLYDNPRNGVSFFSPIPLDHSLIQVVGITSSGFFLEAASNIIPFYPPFFGPIAAPFLLTVATLLEKVSGPVSTGSLRLASTDVRDNPTVRFNYFASPVDLDRCVSGVRKIGDALRSPAMDGFKWGIGMGREFRYVGPAMPANESDDGAMAEFCRRTVTTIWHYHGGCVAGKVVDGDYRVIGIGSLRVVDGSTFYASPGTNPQATVMMMGRYAGQRILEERRTESGNQRRP